MEKKVDKFIYDKKFQKTLNPELSCFLESFNLPKGYFNKDEQLDLFNYLLGLRKKSELTYFSNYLNIETDADVFFDIKKEISEKLENEINTILEKENITVQDIFDLFDYIVSLYKVMDKNSIINYLKSSFEKIKIITSTNASLIQNEEIVSSIRMLSIINYLTFSDIKEELEYVINILKKIKDA